MNLLEAHRIVQEYVDVFAKKRNQPWGISVEYIPSYSEHWKSDLVTSYKLFLAHGLLWQTVTNDSVTQYLNLLKLANTVVPAKEAQMAKQAYQVFEKGKNSKVYRMLHKEKYEIASAAFVRQIAKQMQMFQTDVPEAFNHMLNFRNEVLWPKLDQGMRTGEAVLFYCKEAYKTAGEPYSENDYLYFYSFDQMRKWLNNSELKQFYKPYEEYLYTFKF